MENNIAIRVDHISKQFKIFFDKGSSLKEKVLFKQRRRFETHQVLNDISFDVKKGEALGIIGENGCGKSTLLKMLSRIMYPDQGKIEIDGRVSALIELGAGFHPDMSGRENIYTNAAIFGLSRSEIDARLQDIIDFSELGEFIDNPVRTYSSGMYMRLAFSVAINVDADILLVDEILAVGDAAFQAKCFNRMREIKASGTTIVIVSHSLGQIEQICDRTIWICEGQIREQGKPRDVHPAYMEYMGKKGTEAFLSAEENDEMESRVSETTEIQANPQEEDVVSPATGKRWGNGKARITQVRLMDAHGDPCNVFEVGGEIRVEVAYEILDSSIHPIFGVGFLRDDGFYCYGTNTEIDKLEFEAGKSGVYCFKVSNCPLMSGNYVLDVAIAEQIGFDCDFYRDAARFVMYSKVDDKGPIHLQHAWEIKCNVQ